MAIVTAHVQAVQQLYVAYFNRPADTAGLEYWTNVVEAQQGSTAAVSAAFAAEAEYKTAYAGMTNAQVVNQVYQNLFGRPAEAAGQTYWADLLTAGTITIDLVVAEIAKGALTTDAEAYENKVSGATAFTAALDTKAEQDGYRGADANAQAKAFITSITTDASLAAAVAPATLATTVAKVVAAGTPFTVVGALQSLEGAMDAKAAFLVTADGDGKASTSTDDATLEAAVVTKAAVVEKLLGDPTVTGDAVEAIYNTGSATVKAALVADQQAANATALVEAQAAVVTATGNIAKVAGLQSAISTAAAAETARVNAVSAQKAAAADLAAKLAFYNSTNGVTLTAGVDGDIGSIIVKDGAELVLGTGVTEAKNPGVTALLAATIAQEAAEVKVTKATAVAAATQNTVDYLDTSDAEVAELQAIKAKFVDVTVAAGALPTEAQIAEQLAIFKAKDATATDPDQYETFKGLVDAFYDQTEAENGLTLALTEANADVKTATGNIKAFNDALTALAKAEALVAQSDALDASVAAAVKVFEDRGYFINNVDEIAEFGSSKSDIFIADTSAAAIDSSINLFNLQGSDSLFIGSDYVLNNGALSTGNNAVLEAFVEQVGSDTTITLETSAFGSSAATPEVVVITLVGIDATTIQLNNGIITSVAPTV